MSSGVYRINQNSMDMDKTILNQIIVKHYDEWLKYVRKIAAGYHLVNEAEDILQQAFMDILYKNAEKAILLTSKKASEEELIRRYVQKSIKFNIISPKSFFNRNKKQERKNLNHDIDFSQLSIPDIVESEDDRLSLIWQIFDQLDLPEHQREIFTLYYKNGCRLKQCNEKLSIATVSRICNQICKKIHAQIDVNEIP